MKKQIALFLAGTAAAVAGGLRLVQDLVEKSDRHHPEPGTWPEDRSPTHAPPASPSTDESSEAGAPAKPPPGASKAELYELATSMKITGRSKMSKAELVAAIERAG